MLTLFRSFGHVGEVVEGLDVVKDAEREGSASGKTRNKVVIVDSGVL